MSTEKKSKPSQSTMLVNLALSFGNFVHDSQGAVYARIETAGHFELHAVRSTSFRQLLAKSFFQIEGKTPNAQATADAINTLEGIGQFQGELVDPFIRVGNHYGVIYLDLADPSWSHIGINAEEWDGVLDVNYFFPSATIKIPGSPLP